MKDIKLAINGGKPVRDSLLCLTEPVIGDEEIASVVNVLRSTWLREGKNVKGFEEKISSFVGTKFGVAVSSGTAALHTACAVNNIKKGDEVIVPSFSHVSTANAVLYVGATPVFAEIDPGTYTIDPIDVENKITSKTKAIIPVHWAGRPADMRALISIAERKNLLIIEDACQALGSTYNSQKVGSFGEAACFSFFPSKIITTGEGGMIVTDNEKIYEKAILFRNYGQSWSNRFNHTMLGYNYRMNEIQAALGIAQFGRIDEIIKRKNKIAAVLSEKIRTIEGIILPAFENNIQQVFMHFMIRIDENKFGKSRDFVEAALNAENIQSRMYIPPIHLQPYYREEFNTREGLLPITERLAKDVLTLPCSATMDINDINDIIMAIWKIKNS